MIVAAVAAAPGHAFSKTPRAQITLLAGLGVQGDGHAGETVQHLSRIARDPTQPNLRQVHLLQAELLDDLVAQGFAVAPGDLGENILTRGLDLLALPTGTALAIGAARIRLTGLRTPCQQIERFRTGLLAAVLGRAPDGSLVRKAGVMGVVLAGGEVAPGDPIALTLPPPPHAALAPV